MHLDFSRKPKMNRKASSKTPSEEQVGQLVGFHGPGAALASGETSRNIKHTVPDSWSFWSGRGVYHASLK